MSTRLFSLSITTIRNQVNRCRSVINTRFFSSFSSSSTSVSLFGNRSDLKTLPSSPTDVCVISSPSRGIGLEFAKQILERSESKVIGLIRDPNNKELDELSNKFSNRYTSIAMDLQNQNSIDVACKQVEKLLNGNTISLLLNVAGILGDGKTLPGPERSISSINREWLQQTMDINLIGHIMVSQALLPYLKGDKNKETFSKIASLSARVGSISDNRLGGWYSYRMSKAALNQFTKTASIELKKQRCLTLALHPGTTDTDLSIPFQKNVAPEKLFPVWYSVASMLDVIWESGPNQSGKFYAYDGIEIPW